MSGRIVQASGDAARGDVELRAVENPRPSASAILDADGGFHLPFLRPGVYRLSLDGRDPRTLSVTGGLANVGEIEIDGP